MRHAAPDDIGIGSIVLYILPGLLAYLLPTIVAFVRGYARRWTVLFLNIILGWTGLIWIYLLLMALELV